MATIDSMKFASDEEDEEDYVPAEGELEEGGKGKKRKARAAPKAPGQRGRAFLPDDEDVPAFGSRSQAVKPASPLAIPDAKKSKIDDLWAEMNATPKPAASAATTTTPSSSSFKQRGTTSASALAAARAALKGNEASSQSIVVQQKVDFAGESVTITKTIQAGSKEETRFKREQERKEALGGAASNLDAIVASLEKKKHINTMTKTTLDWDQFKDKEGIEDELAQNRKDGYLEKVKFLMTADQKEYDLQREAKRKKETGAGDS
eukprot:GILK01008071.1.p1 GENE.GILK01008071.1~~GILK01008071.1.p1  ORF type:complete len:285 (+),score=70.33 GILK01008071.1:69-857(+)